MDIEVDDDTFKGIPFVILSDGEWIKNNGSNFYIEFGGKKQIQKVTLPEIVIVFTPYQIMMAYHHVIMRNNIFFFC